jgi:hypothetical protein
MPNALAAMRTAVRPHPPPSHRAPQFRTVAGGDINPHS